MAAPTAIVVSYRVYGREMTVRTNFICDEFALLNGAPTFLTLADAPGRPHEVRIEMPACWRESVTQLPAAGAAPHHYRAADYDALVDAPIVLGNPALYEFEVDGRTHVLANVGEGGVWDGPRSARDLEAIVREQIAFWGGAPYDRYVFLNLITEAVGGLEHLASTVLMTSRWKSRTRKGYLEWLGLASHEFFHAWNVKRLRPVELGPFDYEAENHTRSLWVAEGITTYYGDLARPPRRTVDGARVPGPALGSRFRSCRPRPGVSFRAWRRVVRRLDQALPARRELAEHRGQLLHEGCGRRVSARHRRFERASGGARTLDDVMRARTRGTRAIAATPDESSVRSSARWPARISRRGSRAPWTSTEELDYGPALEWLGLRFRVDPPKPDQPQKAWLGAVTRNDGGRLVVTQVRRDTPAANAGLNVDDEIVAIDEHRVRPEGWDARMEAYRPGDRVTHPRGTPRAADAARGDARELNRGRHGGSNRTTTRLTSSEPGSRGGSPGMQSPRAESRPLNRGRAP